MIGPVFFNDFIEQNPDQTETATDKRNQDARIHDIKKPAEADNLGRRPIRLILLQFAR
jgi:hypothetical protein